LKRRKPRQLYRFGIYGLTAFLLGLLLLALFHRALLRRFVLPEIERRAGEALGLSVTIGDLEVDLRGSLTLTGLEGKAASPQTGIEQIAFKKAAIGFAPMGLLKGRKDWLERVRLEGPCLRLDLDHELVPSPGGGGAPDRAAGAPPRLPELEVAEGEIEIKTGGKDLLLHGVSASLHGLDLALKVEAASGHWKTPRLKALQYPLVVGARLAEGPDPFRLLRVNRLSLGSRDIVKEARLDLSVPGAVRFSGELPGLGAVVSSGQVASGTLDIEVRADDAPVHSIVALFTDWPCPRGRGTGDFHLLLPLEHEEDWQAESDMEVEDVVWESEGIRAERLWAKVRRGGDLALQGELFALGLEHNGLPAADLTGRFRRELLGKDDARIRVDEAVLYFGEGAVALSGSLRERDLFLEHGFLAVAPSPLSAWKGLEPRLEPWQGWAESRVFFDGLVEEPASYQASGWLSANGVWPSGGDGLDLSLEASLSGCQSRVDLGRLSRCGDEIRFAFSSGAALPLEARFSRLDGAIGGFPFQAVDLREVRAGGSSARMEPSRFKLLGGQMELAFESDLSSGRYAVRLAASDLRVAEILRAYFPDQKPEGVLSSNVTLLGSVDGGPDLEAEIDLRDGGLTAGGKELLGIEVEARVKAQGETMELEALKIRRGRDRVELAASGPAPWEWLAGAGRPAFFEAIYSAELSEVANLPFPGGQLRDVGGRLALEGALRGPLGREGDLMQSLDLDARVKVSSGKLKLYGNIPPLVDIQGELALKNDQILVRGLTGRLWDAKFHIAGQMGMTLPWQEGAGIRSVDLTLAARSALFFRRPELRVRGDVDLRWRGPWEQTLLEGDLKITRAYYLQDVSLTPSRGARLPLQLFSMRGAPLETMRFNVRVKSDRGITIKNNIVSTHATADLALGGTGHEPALSGTLSTDEGAVSFGNAKLALKNSFVEFLPSDPLNPRLQIVMGDTIRDHVVTITITGNLDAPEVLMDSSPPLEREKILVLVTTGLTLDEIEKQGVDRVAATQAALYMGKKIARYFSTGDPTEKSFLDRFSLETESAQSARYEDPIRVEYRVKEDLLFKKDELFLQGERDTYGDYNFNLGIRFELD
jgi:hypothetical protein